MRPYAVAALFCRWFQRDAPLRDITHPALSVLLLVKTQSARSASRRAQFQLWIFSYTAFRRSSKKRMSRLILARLQTPSDNEERKEFTES